MTTVERLRCSKCKVALPLPTEPLQAAFPVLQRDSCNLYVWWTFRPRGQFETERRYILCETHGTPMRLWTITAREGVKECGALCRNATGPACDCKCKGENHGGH